jgi:hypothetical protein
MNSQQGNIQEGPEAPASQPATVQPAVQTSPSAQVVPAVATSSQAPLPSTGNSIADAAKKEKQRKACLDLAKSNPSITCQ